MQACSSQNFSVFSANISAVDQTNAQNRWRYQKIRFAQALKLRRQLVRRRARLKQQFQKVLSPELLDELNIRVVLDNRYLQQPGFVGVFDDCGQQWTITLQRRPFENRWFFRSSASPRLYSCSFDHLQTQLCYAVGQYRAQSSALACA